MTALTALPRPILQGLPESRRCLDQRSGVAETALEFGFDAGVIVAEDSMGPAEIEELDVFAEEVFDVGLNVHVARFGGAGSEFGREFVGEAEPDLGHTSVIVPYGWRAGTGK